MENTRCIETDRYGTKRWYRGYELHREDGPAVEWFDGTVEYWLEVKRVEADDLPKARS